MLMLPVVGVDVALTWVCLRRKVVFETVVLGAWEGMSRMRGYYEHSLEPGQVLYLRRRMIYRVDAVLDAIRGDMVDLRV